MKRANKIIMVTVAILLSLVLLSTSLVSGIFARFVVKKQAGTTVGLEKFNVKLTLTPLAGVAVKVNETQNGDSVSITYEALPLYPGADYSKLLNIKVEGKPTVNATFQLSYHIDYQQSSFTVPANVGGTGADTCFMPIGFTFGAKDTTGTYANGYVFEPWQSGIPNNEESPILPDKIESTMVANIRDIFYVSHGADPISNTTDYRIYKYYNLNTNIYLYPRDGSSYVTAGRMNNFDVGFNWPAVWTDPDGNYDYDVIGTYLAKYRSDATISITYTASIRQDKD